MEFSEIHCQLYTTILSVLWRRAGLDKSLPFQWRYVRLWPRSIIVMPNPHHPPVPAPDNQGITPAEVIATDAAIRAGPLIVELGGPSLKRGVKAAMLSALAQIYASTGL